MNDFQKIETSVGTFFADRVEYYENGAVKSAEPQEPVFVRHETGLYMAFDDSPLRNEPHLPTLEFEPDGQIKALRTTGTGLICVPKEGKSLRIGAEWRPDPRDTGANVLIPIRIRFEAKGLLVTDSDGKDISIPYEDYEIQVDYLTDNIVLGSGCGDCSTCDKCNFKNSFE